MTLKPKNSPGQIAFVAGIIVAVALFRVLRATLLPGLPNFSPLMAVAFCGGLFLPGVFAWVLPLAAVAVSDLALSLMLNYAFLDTGQMAAWVCLLAAVAAGRWVARWERVGAGVVLMFLLANALVFYLVTNAVCWLLEPAYPKGLEGFVQSITTGLPGHPPTWLFFRNSLAADILFAGLIFLVSAWAHRPSRRPVPA